VACLLLSVFAQKGLAQVDVESLRAELAIERQSHPRLFVNDSQWPEVRARILNDPLLSQTYTLMQAHADSLLEEDPVERIKTGIRLLFVSRECLKRVSYLSMSYRMTGEEKYLRRAEKEMLAAAAFENWNPSHFLDVAEMTAALAIGYDWLYNDLEPEARKEIRRGIVHLGLITSLKGGWWVNSENNWNQVCNGGLTLGALAVMEDEPELSREIIERAVTNLPFALSEYEPHGVYPEGSSYWKYGTTYNVLLLDALESALGSDFGLMSYEGFKKSPYFYLHSTGTTGLFFNFADGSTRAGISPAMHWFAKKMGDASLLWQEKQNLDDFLSNTSAEKLDDRMLMFLLLWGQSMESVPAPQETHFRGDGPSPVVLTRSAWGKEYTFMGLKAGSPGTNHGHMDIGSFVLDMQGIRWAVDLGAQEYYSLESKGLKIWNRAQDSDRWTVFRLGTSGHNVLMVDGEMQHVDQDARIVASSNTGTYPHAVVESTNVYEGQLKKALRGIQVTNNWVTVQDEIEALDKPTAVRWGMLTRAQVRVVSGNTAQLQQNGKEIFFRVESPLDVTIRVEDLEQPRQEFDVANPNTRMIVFDVELEPSEATRIAVHMYADFAESTLPKIEALVDWK